MSKPSRLVPPARKGSTVRSPATGELGIVIAVKKRRAEIYFPGSQISGWALPASVTVTHGPLEKHGARL